MLACVVTIHVRPEKMNECIRIFRERNTRPSLPNPFHHGHWWVDRVKGEASSVTFWENAADERTSRPNIPGLVERMADVLASHEVYQETFESVRDQYVPGSGRRHRPPGWDLVLTDLAMPEMNGVKEVAPPEREPVARKPLPHSGSTWRSRGPPPSRAAYRYSAG